MRMQNFSEMMKNTQNNLPNVLTLNLFGPLEAWVHGEPLPKMHSRKSVWLLVLLTLRQGKLVERDWLVSTLWPDSGQSQALAYLRQSLTELRHALGSEADRLQTPTRATLALDLSGASVDLLTFDTAIQQGDRASLESAVAVYKGPFLEGCAEEWTLPERTNREQSYLTALQRLAEEALARGETRIATDYLRRIVAVDILQEGAQRLLMQALVKEGNYAAATQVYRDLRLHLHREMNAEPDPQTTALYNQLRTQTRQKAQRLPRLAPNPAPSLPPRHLPHPLTELLGREEDIGPIAVRLRQRRLVTLTGTGGVGKTRLAIAVADETAAEYADGVFFVELAPLSDPTLVLQAVASALQVREAAKGSLRETLVNFLRPKLLLLVLDNCEHLLEACARLAEDLLQVCTGVRILATSRQALGITGEVDWQVPSLPVPDLTHLPAKAAELLADMSDYASVQLFVERAEAVQKTFALTPQNAFSVAQICQRLDGIPLAMELAASAIKALPIEAIVQRLDDVFRLLTRGSSTALPRQRTLRATLDWSYALLTEAEQSLLKRLSVFAGGWTLEAAEQVCSGADGKAGQAVASWEILEWMANLTDKSLVTYEERAGETRYRLLETVRQYARDRLVESGESVAVRIRHSDYFLTLTEEIKPKLRTSAQGQWLEVLEKEHDNLRQALIWYAKNSEDAEAGEKGLRLGAALQLFWWTRGYVGEGREWMSALLAHLGGQESTKARADALHGAGVLAYMQADYASARVFYGESLTVARKLGNKESIAKSLSSLGNVFYAQSDYVQARVLQEESLAIARELGDRRVIANSLNNLGNVAYAQNDYAQAYIQYEESLSIQRELEDKGNSALTLGNLGNVANSQGNHTQARIHYEESLTIGREIGDRRVISDSLYFLGNVAYAQNDYDQAHTLFEESLSIRRELGDKRLIAYSLGNLGNVVQAQNDYARARELFAESLGIRREVGDRSGIVISLHDLGNIANALGDYDEASLLHRESLTIARALGDRRIIAYILEAIAALALNQTQGERCAHLWGAATALRATIGSPLMPAEREKQEQSIAIVKQTVGEAAFAHAWAQGHIMPMEQAVEYALEKPA